MKLDFTKPVDDWVDCRRLKSKPGYRILLAVFCFFGMAIPKGFEWDGASSPLLFRWLVPKFDHSLISSLIHDYLCSIAKNAEERRIADAVYRKVLVDIEGRSRLRAWFAHKGVRIGSWWGSGVHYPHWIKDNIWPLLRIK